MKSNIISSTYDKNHIFEEKVRKMSPFKRGTEAARSLWLQRRFLHKAKMHLKAKNVQLSQTYLSFWDLERSYWRYLIA